MGESRFQALLIKDLKDLFPGCMVLKNDASYLQGIPDLLILHGRNWAALEVKDTESARLRPNQAYYVELMNEMSYANFVYPGNREEVLRDLQQALNA